MNPNNRFRPQRKKICLFCKENKQYIDYKRVELLRRYTTEKGKILPRRVTGCCAMHQRKLGTAIKRARYISLLSFVGSGY
ncbi:MAG: 30S ribosomal protein S18 [Candidatus Wallbacteria bacterium]|nr:30S ribosomal protein S18 [Candidatus Wallbacteria bacterium]